MTGLMRIAFAAFAWQPVPPLERAEPVAVQPSERVAPPVARNPGPLTAFDEISARPIFSDTRRPFAPPPPPPLPQVAATPSPVAPRVAPPPAPPQLVLTGVVLGPPGPVAIVGRETGGEPLHLHIGQQVDGWEVVSIMPTGVELKNGPALQPIVFPKAASAGSAGAPSVAPGATPRGRLAPAPDLLRATASLSPGASPGVK